MTMCYRTRKGEVLTGDMFIDCTGRVAKIVAPQTSADSDGEVVTALSDIHDSSNESMKNFVSPFDMKSGLIAVDEHLMVRSSLVINK
jgi:isoaspartyl peptidase/L-asparaginase-like protein (Ntn-hydrolase superfamily)